MPAKMLAALTAGVMALLPWPALAAPSCMPRDQALSWLAERYDERPVAQGLASNGALLELLASPDGGTWTIMLSTARGVSCPFAAGTDWQALEVAPVPAGEPL